MEKRKSNEGKKRKKCGATINTQTSILNTSNTFFRIPYFPIGKIAEKRERKRERERDKERKRERVALSRGRTFFFFGSFFLFEGEGKSVKKGKGKVTRNFV